MLTNADAQTAGEKLTNAAQLVTEWMDILSPLMDTDACLQRIRSMDASDMQKLAQKIPADCLHAVLVDIGKRIWEENLFETCCIEN